jgi:hypothetical protein
VTSARRPGTPAAERKRQQRARDAALMYERQDWQLFLDLVTLPRKAGCQPKDLGQIVLRELVDNGLDNRGNVSLHPCVGQPAPGGWIIADDVPA